MRASNHNIFGKEDESPVHIPPHIRAIREKGASGALAESDRNSMVLDSDSFPPLHRACARGDLGLIFRLLERGAPINEKTTYDFTPLHFACDAGASWRTIKSLLDYGANVEDKTDHKYTSLGLLCDEGFKEVATITALFSNLNSGPADLHNLSSIFTRKMENARLLIDHGVDVNTTDINDQTCLTYVSKNGLLDYCAYVSGLESCRAILKEHFEIISETLGYSHLKYGTSETKDFLGVYFWWQSRLG